MKVDNEKILELIIITLDNLRQKYIFKMQEYNKMPMVKVLTQFTTFLLANKYTTFINNRQLKKPNSQIRKRYEYIQSAISRPGLKKRNNNKNKLILNIDIEINNLKKKLNFRT